VLAAASRLTSLAVTLAPAARLGPLVALAPSLQYLLLDGR
jgi:hypothetical protein